jgi:hypothetical protein
VTRKLKKKTSLPMQVLKKQYVNLFVECDMSEKNFRIVLGAWLIAGLLLNSHYVIYALAGLLLFEGITNIRVPGLISRMRSHELPGNESAGLNPNARVSFEAERGLRLIVIAFVLIPMHSDIEFLWLLPWFVGFALIGAGLSGICPMVLALRWLGLR